MRKGDLAERNAYRERPKDERMLESAARLTIPECNSLRDQLQALAYKEGLTDEDRAEMRRLRAETEDHPSGRLLDELLTLRGRGPEWLDLHITEILWGWAWWAEFYGLSVDAYMRKGRPDRPKGEVDAVLASLPYPEGWKPQEKR